MKFIYSMLALSILLIGCQPPPDNSANEAFEKNSKTAMTYLEGFQNENVDYSALYSDSFLMRDTGFEGKDSVRMEEVMEMDKSLWAGYDFELVTDPVVFLPGVNVETRQPDGSVRYYGDWRVTLSATDSTEAKSGVLKMYESFDFDETGKIVFQQAFGDFSGLMNYLHSNE